jgi:SOS-response transcriptional repressor LexA
MQEKTRKKLRVTAKQKEAREAVDKFIALYKYPPSYRELQIILKLKSPSATYHRLRGYRHKMIKSKPLKK